jgi:hypothetical protein
MGRIVGETPLPVEESESRTVPRGMLAPASGDSVPEPLGFIAFTPECLFYTGGT